MTQPISQLKKELTNHIDKAIQLTHKLQQLSLEELTWRESPKSWNILECIEHLNRYGGFYLSEIEKEIIASKYDFESDFKSGWLGNYFAESMLPNAKNKAMKTFKNKNPLGASLDRSVIEVFFNQQQQLLLLFKDAETVSWNKTKVKISIAKWIKIRLGDTFRFMIYHNTRHCNQIGKILKNHSAI
ncbi:MAG: DinB family protein [Limnohabitans sp.]|nr:DinB family protein [Limnohabitans sp.]